MSKDGTREDHITLDPSSNISRATSVCLVILLHQPVFSHWYGYCSVVSDIISSGRIVLAILNLLPTTTANFLHSVTRATTDDLARRPLLTGMFAAL